jgi:hypothetical protein
VFLARDYRAKTVGQVKGLWRDTWWLWCILLVLDLSVSYFVTPFLLAMLPVLTIVFGYFAYMRYDDDGNDIGGK